MASSGVLQVTRVSSLPPFFFYSASSLPYLASGEMVPSKSRMTPSCGGEGGGAEDRRRGQSP